MSRQAAAKMHELYHGGKLETGSPNVLAHNQPVWRSDVDQHVCAGGAPPTDLPPGTAPVDASSVSADGPEVLKEGAERVLVNGHRIGREGDFLLGAGSPNMIAPRNGFRVYVGENAIGSDTESFQEKYCKELCALKADWDKLSVEERIARWKDMTRNLFRSLGMPEPTFTGLDVGSDYGGSMGNNFEFSYHPNYFNGTWTPDDLGDMTWHELRHGEQSFHGLRYAMERERRGISPKGQKSLIKRTDPRIVRAAQEAGPLDDSTAEGRWAAMFADGDFTTAGQERIGWAVRDMKLYDGRYPTIPAGGDVRRDIDGSHGPGASPKRSRRCTC